MCFLLLKFLNHFSPQQSGRSCWNWWPVPLIPWPDAIIVSDTLHPNGRAFYVHVCKSIGVCVCVSRRTAGEGREEETLIEIPSAMSGRALVSEWHTHTCTHTHKHAHTYSHTGPGPNKSGLCHMEAMCKTDLSVLQSVCTLLAGEACTAPQTDRQMHTNLWHVSEGVWVIKTHLWSLHTQTHTFWHTVTDSHTYSRRYAARAYCIIFKTATRVLDVARLIQQNWQGNSGQVNVGVMFCSRSATTVNVPSGQCSFSELWQSGRTSRCV